MNTDEGQDDDLSRAERSLLIEVATGSCPVDDERVRAASAANPAFADRLHGVIEVVDRLAAWRASEAAALAAPASALDAVAVAAARRGLEALTAGSGAGRGSRRRWPLLLAAAAAGLFACWLLLRQATDAPRQRIWLGSGVTFVIDVEHRLLRFEEPPPITMSYEVGFGRGDAVITTLSDVESVTLPLPDLSPYLPLEWVQVSLMADGDERRSSGRVPLPAALGR